MSNEKQETIADIVAEMRSNEFDDPSFNVYSLVAARTLARGWADRIEAAVNQPVTNCNHMGDAARMREALKKAQTVLSREIVFYGTLKSDDAYEASKAVTSALSAPPRNCDRFSNANEALEAFETETGETMIEFIRWLFAVFAEAKGGVK